MSTSAADAHPNARHHGSNQTSTGSAPDPRYFNSDPNKVPPTPAKPSSAGSHAPSKLGTGSGQGTPPPPAYTNQTGARGNQPNPVVEYSGDRMTLAINEVAEMCALAIEINTGIESLRASANPDTNSAAWHNFYQMVMEHRKNLVVTKNLFTQIKETLDGAILVLGAPANEGEHSSGQAGAWENTIRPTIEILPSGISNTPSRIDAQSTPVNSGSGWSTVPVGVKALKQQQQQQQQPYYDSSYVSVESNSEKYHDASESPYIGTSDAYTGSQANLKSAKGFSKIGRDIKARLGMPETVPAYQKELDRKVKKLKERCDDFSDKLKEALYSTKPNDPRNEPQEIRRLLGKIQTLNDAFTQFQQISEPPIARPDATDNFSPQTQARGPNVN